MDFTDSETTEMFEPGPVRGGPDRRRVALCFGVCLFAAAAIFFVARAGGDRAPGSDGQSPTDLSIEVPTEDSESRPGLDPESSTEDPDERRGRSICDLLGAGAPKVFGCDAGGEPEAVAPSPVPADTEDTPADAGWVTSAVAVGGRSGSLRHPADWIVADKGEEGLAVAEPSGVTGLSVVASDARRSSWDGVAESYVEQFRAYAPDVELLEHGPMSLNGMDGYRVRMTGTLQGLQFESEAWFLIDRDLTWIVTYMHSPGDDDGERLATSVARTFARSESA